MPIINSGLTGIIIGKFPKAHTTIMTTIIPSAKQTENTVSRIPTMLAFGLIPLSGFATDIYIPSLPTMGLAIHVSSIQVQLTLSFFLISYGISQLFIGSVLDSFGRYKLCLISLIVFALASVVIANTHNIFIIYLMRIVHGISVAIIIVAKRAYFVDVFSGDKLKHILSLFTIIWSTGPIVAPFIGGYLQSVFGWQSNFYFLAAYAIIIAALEFAFSGETLKHFTPFNVKNIARIYADMITTTSFTFGLVMLGLAFSMVMVCNMTAPFIIEHHLRLTPVIAGYSALILGLSWMLGGFIGKATIHKPFYNKLMLNMGLQIVFIAAMIFSLPFAENLFTLLFFAFIIHASAGYTYNNYFTYCMGKFPKNAGIAGGLMGGVIYVIISILSYGMVAIIPAKDERNLSYSYLILGLLSAVVMVVIFLINRRKTKADLNFVH
jgi:DHA1 family bicyclomycin/chloramphenicol resistance-like MFS transporter